MKSQKITAYDIDFQFLADYAKGGHEKSVIYGCGTNGEVICAYLRQYGSDIAYFVDQQAERRTFSVLGKNVISPKAFFRRLTNEKIIVSPDNWDPILQYLKENGVRDENILPTFKKIETEVRILEADYEPPLRKAEPYGDSAGEPQATVFTILYNTPKWMLCRAIESVLSQSFQNFRYLLIDNGSNDGSEDVVKKYAAFDSRIRHIRLDRNALWTETRLLTALKENIPTKYVAMLDSDDFYEPTFLEKTIQLADSSGAELVQTNTLTYAHDGFRHNCYARHLGRDIVAEGECKNRLFLLRFIYNSVWGKLFRGDLFRNLIDMMLSYSSEHERDRNFCLDISWITYLILACNRVAICDEPLHVRTWRPGSSENSDKHSSKWLSSSVWSFERLREEGVPCEELEVFEDSHLMWLFTLARDNLKFSDFRAKDLDSPRVAAFMRRPVCDKFRGDI